MSAQGLDGAAAAREIVALDVGGTKLAAARIVSAGAGWRVVETRVDPTASVLDPVLAVRAVMGRAATPKAIGIGVAAPVTKRQVTLTNLPWTIDADAMALTLGCPVFLMNDLEALAHGVLALDGAGLSTIAAGTVRLGGKALVAAGTGLGVALMPWDGARHLVVPTEAGHTDFAPGSADEDELLGFLRARYLVSGDGHVSWERVVSGLDGFANLVAFLGATKRISVPAATAAHVAEGVSLGKLVGEGAVRGEPWAEVTVRWFARLYGAAAGNVVLSSLALGGLYLGGGVTSHLLAALSGVHKAEFLNAFRAKGRFAGLLGEVPVYAVTEPNAALIGAAARADALAALDASGRH